jgi:uncharacterized protein (UPF0297 family)
MGGGLVQLAGYGLQDMFLTYKPTITYFKMVYKRHTNFSSESIPQFFQNKPNFGGRYTCNISKNGDLMGQIYLCVTLPNLPSIIDTNYITQNNNLQNIAIMGWTEKIGYALIKTIEFEVGGKVIDKLYGDWLNIWYELTQKNNKKALDILVGNIDKLTKYENSKGSYLLHIPIPFYFCKYKGLALPLIALEYSDVKLNVEFNNLLDVLIVGPTNSIKISENIVNFLPNEIITQTVNNITSYAKFIKYDENTQLLYYIKYNNNLSFVSNVNIIGSRSHYTVMPNNTEVNFLSTILNVYDFETITLGTTFFYVDYIYLDNIERLKFARSNHEYLIEHLQYDNEKIIINNNNKINILYNHPTKAIFFVTQYDYIITSNLNDIFNYTNNIDKKKGYNIVNQVSFLLNGKDRLTPRSSDYYSYIQNYQQFSNAASEGINMYSFAINSEEYQPSGSCNFSRIDDITLSLSVDSSVSYSNPARVRVYTLSYNIFRIINGVAGLAFDK